MPSKQSATARTIAITPRRSVEERYVKMPRKVRKKTLYKRKTDKFHTPKKKTEAVTTAPASAPARLKAPPPPPPQAKETNQISKEPGVFFTPPPTKRSARFLMGEQE